MRLKLITAPTNLPVTLTEAKNHLRVSGDLDDTYITSLIEAAAGFVDGIYGMGFCLMPQTWEMALDRFNSEVKIPIYPVSSVASVAYVDSEGAEQTVASSVYQLNNYGSSPNITLKYNQNWPTSRNIADAVKIRFIAGFESLPEDLKHAVLLLVGHWYENREAATSSGTFSETPFAVKAILNKYAVAGIA